MKDLLMLIIDFYTYQSGHVLDSKEDLMRPATMAKAYYNMNKKRPIINLEPMYDAHGFGNRVIKYLARKMKHKLIFTPF